MHLSFDIFQGYEVDPFIFQLYPIQTFLFDAIAYEQMITWHYGYVMLVKKFLFLA